VHLKSLTLKGFKSFASATTLRFEPGITCVVGPNGSGKSNVVDALTWVMGEQGAKSLRGGKMEDVIFAGTAGRAPLGRAEVTLTIDNADGALDIDYPEVSITRRMFRDGASEYEINGSTCRLMDVQDLLSDSGIGREMHVVVGQGRLAGILESRPEERRGFIEEAAGVLKHRKRKEKALRKLDAMQANLARLGDLTAELRRQLKPLGRQAEVAKRAQTVQADLRDARLRLAADDVVTRRAELAGQQADEAAARAEHEQVQAALTAAEHALAQVQAAAGELEPAARRAQDTWYRLTALSERLGATVQVAAERARHLSAPAPTAQRGPDPAELDVQAEQAAVQQAELDATVTAAAAELTAAAASRGECEQALADTERAHQAELRAVAGRREAVARLSGQVDALRSATQSSTAELEGLSVAIAEATRLSAAAQQQFDAVQAEVSVLDARELELDAAHERATAASAAAQATVADLAAEHLAAEQDAAAGQARVDGLTVGLTRRDGAAWLREHHPESVLGATADLLRVRRGFESAVAAALGPLADALVVDGAEVALDALRALKAGDGGSVGLLLRDVAAAAPTPGPALPEPSPGVHRALDLVDGSAQLIAALAAVLGDVVVVADLEQAAALVAREPGTRVVTRHGDVLGHGWAAGGSDRAPSTLEVQAAVDDAARTVVQAAQRAADLAHRLAVARAHQHALVEAAQTTGAALTGSDADLAAVAERLGALGGVARTAAAEVHRLGEAQRHLHRRRDLDVVALQGLTRQLSEAHAEPGRHEPPPTDARDAIAAELASARSEEVQARLQLRTAEERAAPGRGRAESLRRSARSARDALVREEAAQRTRSHAAQVAADVVAGGEHFQAVLTELLARAVSERDTAAGARSGAEQQLGGLREQVRALRQHLAGLTDTVHRDEVARAQAALRVEQLEAVISEQHGLGLDELVAEFGPDVALAPTAQELAEYALATERGEQVSAPRPSPFDRAIQTRRARQAEQDLAMLGRVNPLALEEFTALEERHQFLATQLQDVRDTRRDLLGVVDDVDARILEAFTTAFHDVAAEFGAVFETLFPGGEGRLVLTDPDDMLTTGIEVEARPPGKKIKRLSLLSGGEKSLTAVAMLVAIFRARPSPFYVMDEVEAALDDTNLQRLIRLFEQLRERSQLIVITHQKATMEVADALYGVSMRGDGITTVISQRLRGTELRAPTAH